MTPTETATPPIESMTDAEAIQYTPEYYFAILEGRNIYHIAHSGETICGMVLAERSSRWFKRGSEKVIPPEMTLCQFCDSAFHRELALSKTHIREALVRLVGVERRQSGTFSKQELADILAAIRKSIQPDEGPDAG